MFRFNILILLFFLSFTASAQRQFPVVPVNIDSLLDLAADPKAPKERSIHLIRKIDTILAGYEIDYPLYRGMLYMYQALDMPDTLERKIYRNNAISLIGNNTKHLADSFSYQLMQLLEFYTDAGRRNEWLPIDSILRNAVAANPSEIKTSLLAYLYNKLASKSWHIARNLSNYEIIFSPQPKDTTIEEEYANLAPQWVKLKARYELWKATPYYKRNENLSFKQGFEELIRKTGYLKHEMVMSNSYGKKGFNKDYRTIYYFIHLQLVMDLADWAINDHREGVAILPLRLFLLEDLIPNEMDAASKAGMNPVINVNQLRDAFKMLSQLYINIGNGAEAFSAAFQGVNYINNYKSFSEKERNDAFYTLYYLFAETKRTEGKYESAMKAIIQLKKFYPAPASVHISETNYWNTFIDVRLQEIEILQAQNKNVEAKDSLSHLFDQIAPIDSDSSEMLYNLYQWPRLQYMTMKLIGEKINWESSRSTLLDALTTIEQKNRWENVPYYYSLQSLYFISHFRSKNEVLKHVLHNLLFYTERNLKYSFIALSPEDRMRLYEQRLGNFFDLYHELLFTGRLDSFPDLKEKVIQQSLYLKNALADNNLLPNRIFKANPELLALVEEIRLERMNSNILTHHNNLAGRNESASDLKSRTQLLWLNVLKYVNTDSIYTAYTWQNISSALKSQQVYIETVRYSGWLSDSSAKYGAYVINDNSSLSIVPLFREDSLVQILKDPSASPQTGLLNTAGTRGLTIKGKKETSKKKFNKGDTDKLGLYILNPLWKYLLNKKEILVVPDALLNRISIAALQWKKKDLYSYIQIRQLSGSNVLFQPTSILQKNSRALLAGGLNYSFASDTSKRFTLLNKNVTWNYLPGTKAEIEKLNPVFNNASVETDVFTTNAFPDSLRKSLSNYHLIHLATHGFYFDSSVVKDLYSNYVYKEAVRNDPMMRCGIAMSYANQPEQSASIESEGYLLGFELANTDLRNCYLISLSACETGLGDLRNNLGVDGLSRALKLGGARHLLISLWKVPDAPTAVFMQYFYKHLFAGKTPAQSLRLTQQVMSSDYPASDWAAFILVE
jgi:CHAT domain-containing protein